MGGGGGGLSANVQGELQNVKQELIWIDTVHQMKLRKSRFKSKS